MAEGHRRSPDGLHDLTDNEEARLGGRTSLALDEVQVGPERLRLDEVDAVFRFVRGGFGRVKLESHLVYLVYLTGALGGVAFARVNREQGYVGKRVALRRCPERVEDPNRRADRSRELIHLAAEILQGGDTRPERLDRLSLIEQAASAARRRSSGIRCPWPSATSSLFVGYRAVAPTVPAK